jgi:hypothetical protein
MLRTPQLQAWSNSITDQLGCSNLWASGTEYIFSVVERFTAGFAFAEAILHRLLVLGQVHTPHPVQCLPWFFFGGNNIARDRSINRASPVYLDVKCHTPILR